MDNTSKQVPDGFADPIAGPANTEQRERWQAANRSWWQNRPMRYDFSQPISHPEFSKEFYDEIDRRFFEDVREFMPWKRIPFDPLIDFDALKHQDVLEIGVGNGSHAALLAAHARSFTGIDLTDYAVKSTSTRLRNEGLPGRVLEMDAESMSFPDASFDFVWSWGVIHHSSDTASILREIARVLRPGGRAVTIIYHRSVWNYYVIGGLIHGVLRGGLLKESLHEVVQHQIDGALARYYTIPEWEQLTSRFLRVERVWVYGSKLELIPLPGGSAKQAVRRLTPNPISRFFTNTCRFGTFLVTDLRKPAADGATE